jgi:hypothetical protein
MIRGAKPMSWKEPAAFAVTLAILAVAAARGVANETPAPMTIQEQGSFAVGGTIVTAPGTFDPIGHGAYNPADQSVAGQTLHGDHAYVFYQVPTNARRLPLVMWHGHGQSGKTWERRPTAARDSRPSFCGADSRCTSSTSRGAAARLAARCP